MAFLDVHPDWQIETGFRLDPSALRVTRTSRRHFTCERTDPSNDTPIRAEQQGIFPREGDPDPDDPTGRFCVSAQIKPFGLTALECFADYESVPVEIDAATQQQVLAGWTFEFDTEESEEPIDRARDVFPRDGRDTAAIEGGQGLAITTIAGESYDPPLTDIASDLAFTFSTTNRRFNPLLLWIYRNAVNEDTFLGVFPPGTCRMRQCRGTQSKSSDGSIQMSVNCRVVIRSASPGSTDQRAWWKRVRAEGFYARTLELNVSDEPGKVRVLDDYGEPSVKPALHYTTGVNRGVQIFGDDAHENAEFYEFQPPSVRYLPFNSFFQAIVAG